MPATQYSNTVVDIMCASYYTTVYSIPHHNILLCIISPYGTTVYGSYYTWVRATCIQYGVAVEIYRMCYDAILPYYCGHRSGEMMWPRRLDRQGKRECHVTSPHCMRIHGTTLCTLFFRTKVEFLLNVCHRKLHSDGTLATMGNDDVGSLF